MTDQTSVRSRGGRPLLVYGDPSLLTMDRLESFLSRIDTDPRIASLSLVAAPADATGTWLRSAGPAGPLIAIAVDLDDLIGPVHDIGLEGWCASASSRGLWHDWLLVGQPDVTRASPILEPAAIDSVERSDPSGAHYHRLRDGKRASPRLAVAIDITWLGPHETGAQVLTTAAIGALARHPSIREILLFGRDELPAYAAHLDGAGPIRLLGEAPDVSESDRADIVWYPNQIDQRSNISAARSLGRRVVTTYLDLIAYDIPRYHRDFSAWQAYRSLQRRIALSVDGITTISADVAERLMAEVPRLSPERVLALPLGLDHITEADAPPHPGDDLSSAVESLAGRPFLLVLGNDFVHKNRDFAIRVWQALPADLECDLVLAGLHVRASSSKAAEGDVRASGTSRSGVIRTVGHVSSASRAWLLSHAAAVVYPSSAEGFGLVPYEAAALGTPTTFTDFGPLREISGAPGLPSGWSIDAYAADVEALLTSWPARERRIADLQAAIAAHTWNDFADRLVAFFAEVAASPATLTSTLGISSASQSAELAAILSSRSWRLLQPARAVARRLRRH